MSSGEPSRSWTVGRRNNAEELEVQTTTADRAQPPHTSGEVETEEVTDDICSDHTVLCTPPPHVFERQVPQASSTLLGVYSAAVLKSSIKVGSVLCARFMDHPHSFVDSWISMPIANHLGVLAK
ncbi:Hypothetical predicted protein [Pelobates cultripes]|uniref:Uncharacterized protein n=1 Tax=Pelobates cultripes TaxID=61616 RepID=A0AAD1RDS1_PELCU|nr:Hypothetical predicted protein [Pelobates cultripes]